LHVLTYFVLLLYPFSGFIFGYFILYTVIRFSVEPEINNYSNYWWWYLGVS